MALLPNSCLSYSLAWAALDAQRFSYALQCSLEIQGQLSCILVRTHPGGDLSRALLRSVCAAPVLAGGSLSHRTLKPVPKPIQTCPQSVPPEQQRVLRRGSWFP